MENITLTKKILSIIRNLLNSFRRIVISDPLVQKKISVYFHNILAICDFKKNYEEELFNYKKIIAGRQNFWTNEYDYGNTYYGNAYILKSYSGYKKKIKACIEHGLYFGDTVFHFEAIDSGLGGLITYGDSRVKHLQGIARVPVIPIGPYIHYAEPLLDEKQIYEIKRKNGKTLLVFPTHSIDRVETEYNMASFCDEIDRVVEKMNIQKVIVCLFYKDINIGRDQYYIEKGYQVVCNGYRCDPLFLRRLKTFILISDYTMSNDVGTNVGYCIYLGKPHYIFSQEVSYNAYTNVDMENIMHSDSVELEMREVREAFSELSSEITIQQKTICNKYWGGDYIKTKEELYEVLRSFE